MMQDLSRSTQGDAPGPVPGCWESACAAKPPATRSVVGRRLLSGRWAVRRTVAALQSRRLARTHWGAGRPADVREDVPRPVELRWRPSGDQAASSLVGVTAMVASRA